MRTLPSTRITTWTLINAQGAVIASKVIESSGNATVDNTILDVARRTTYSPAIVNCLPVASVMTLQFLWSTDDRQIPTAMQQADEDRKLQAAVDSATHAINSMLKSGHADTSTMSPTLLFPDSPRAIDANIAERTTGLGAYLGVELMPAGFEGRFERGTVEVELHLDDHNRVDAFYVQPPRLTNSSSD